jgi:hypothetical protein
MMERVRRFEDQKQDLIYLLIEWLSDLVLHRIQNRTTEAQTPKKDFDPRKGGFAQF